MKGIVNRILTFALSCVLVLTTPVYALESEIDNGVVINALADTTTNVVTVSGQFPEDGVKQFTLMILKDSISIDDVNTDNFVESIDFFIQEW